MDNFLRKRFQLRVKAAIEESRAAKSTLEHPVLTGLFREILVEQMLKPALPPEIGFGTGALVNRYGNQSGQIDVVLYSSQILPPALFDVRTGVFPAEACLYAIEVKSKLSKHNLAEAIKNAQKLKRLELLETYQHRVNFVELKDPPVAKAFIESRPHGIVRPLFTLFAFESNSKRNSEQELKRIVDAISGTDYLFHAICVVGKGYWYFDDTLKVYRYYPPTIDYDEVLSFLAGISNTIPKLLVAKGRPNFGSYLIEDDLGKPITFAK